MPPKADRATSAALMRALTVLALLAAFQAPALADDSFGPPVRTCGGEGEKPCSEGGKVVAAIDKGAAKNWGCPGQDFYFTPHNGGECWSCPSGYARTLIPIHHKINACTKRGPGNAKKNSKFVRSVFGCPAGQFHRLGRCLACPGSANVNGWLGINPAGQCTTKPGCNPGLQTEAGPPGVLTKNFAPFHPRCTAKKNPVDVIVSEGGRALASQTDLTGAALAFATEVAADAEVRDAIRAKDGARIWREMQAMRSFHQFRSKAEARGFRSISLGSSFGAQAIVGTNQEQGVVFDWNGALKPYTTTVVSAGAAVGVDASFTLGVWKDGLSSFPGYSQGAAVGIPTGTPGIGPSVGAAVEFSYAPMQFSGFSVTAGVGVGAELGKLESSYTQAY